MRRPCQSQAARCGAARGVYPIDDVIAAADAPPRTSIAARHNGNYHSALRLVAVGAAIIIAICAVLGRESRVTEFAKPAS